MSLLTICQNVAKDIPVEVPSVISGNSNETATLLLSAANRAGKSIARRKGRIPWISLTKEHTFTTDASTAGYSLPSDFLYLANYTVWDRTNYWSMRAGLTPQQWQEYQSSVLGNTVTTHKRFRIRNVSGTTKFWIDPDPSSADSLVFEYVSNQWCQSEGGAGQTAWQADTDTAILDEYLIELEAQWRFLKRLGMTYEDEFEEAEKEIKQALAREGGAPILELNKRRELSFISGKNVPDTGYG